MPETNPDITLFKAMADETRLRILRLLCLEELNVWELGLILELPQPTISRHLATLRHSGMVIDRRDGNRVFYRVGELKGPLACLADYLEHLSSHSHPDVERLEECLKNRAAGTRMFADNKAAEWDELAKAFQQHPAQLFMLAGLPPHDLIIADLGTGTGLLLPFLAELGSRVYAVDQSPAMLRRARLRCSRNAIENVIFIHSQLEELKNEVPLCDAMVLHFVLHQVARPSALLHHLRTFMKRQGRIAIVDRIQHDNEAVSEKYGSVWHGFTYHQLREWLEAAGLRIIKWHALAGAENNGDNLAVFVLIAESL